MIERHATDKNQIIHGKQDRNNEEKIDCAEHIRFDLPKR